MSFLNFKKIFDFIGNLGQRPNYSDAEQGRVFLNHQSGTIHEWSGNSWIVHNEAINIRDYGLENDEALATELQRLVSMDRPIYHPSGRYKISKQIDLNPSLIADNRGAPKIIGDGPLSTVFLNGVANGSLFSYKQNPNQYFTRGYGLEFRDFGILSAPSAPANSNGISVSGAVNPVFQNILIRGISGHGFYFPFDLDAPLVGTGNQSYINADAFSNGYSTARSCAVELCGGWGYRVDVPNSPISMTDSYASGCAQGGLYLQSGNSILNNVSFSYCGTSGNSQTGGLFIGDDYGSAHIGAKARSYQQIFAVSANNVELDSNKGPNLVLCGYFHDLNGIRLIQNSLMADNPAYPSARYLARLGYASHPLTRSKIKNTVVRVTGTNAAVSVFKDGINFAGQQSTDGGYAWGCDFEGLYNLYPSPDLTLFDLTSSYTTKIKASTYGDEILFSK